jgi:hypothetical protein
MFDGGFWVFASLSGHHYNLNWLCVDLCALILAALILFSNMTDLALDLPESFKKVLSDAKHVLPQIECLQLIHYVSSVHFHEQICADGFKVIDALDQIVLPLLDILLDREELPSEVGL